jgi:hypothetical protein
LARIIKKQRHRRPAQTNALRRRGWGSLGSLDSLFWAAVAHVAGALATTIIVASSDFTFPHSFT